MGVLGGLDLPQPLVQRLGGGLVAGGFFGVAGGEQLGEQLAALGADDVAGEELADDLGSGSPGGLPRLLFDLLSLVLCSYGLGRPSFARCRRWEGWPVVWWPCRGGMLGGAAVRLVCGRCAVAGK